MLTAWYGAGHRLGIVGDPGADGAAERAVAEIQARTAPVRSGKQPRILFGTQASTRPPRFVLFTTGFFEAQYRRFVERRLREAFGFAGTRSRSPSAPAGKRRR